MFSPRRNYFWCSKGFGWLTSEAEGYKPLKWKIKERILQGRKKLIWLSPGMQSRRHNFN
jgi:hypothetical protein